MKKLIKYTSAILLSLSISIATASPMSIVVDRNGEKIAYVTKTHLFDLDRKPVGYILDNSVILSLKTGKLQGLIIKGVIFDNNQEPVAKIIYHIDSI